jgi:hypothetical protein
MIPRPSARSSVLALAFAALASVATIAACGERIEAGLANAPSLERKSDPRSQYDVIAVGDEGCGNRDGGAGIASRTAGCRQNTTLFADASGDPAR